MEDLTLKKYTLHRLKSKLIDKKYEHCIKAETDICSLIENYIENLKTINTLYSRADIESLKYGGTCYPDTLFRNEQIYRHKFFAMVIGIIDGWKMELMKFNNYNEYCEELNLIYNLRYKVINDYKRNVSICDPRIIIKVLEHIPCYEDFNNNIKNENDIKIYLEFIESYIKGINNHGVCGLNDIYDIYKRLLKSLNKCKKNNKNKVYKLKKDNSTNND